MSDLVKESKELLEILRTAPKTIRTNKLSYDDTWNDWDNEEDEEDKLGAFCQYTTIDGATFAPAHHTCEILPPGVYEVLSTQSGIAYEKIPVKTDDLIQFPETNSELVIAEIKNFWEREDVKIAIDKIDKNDKAAIIDSMIDHKNTKGSIQFCNLNNILFLMAEKFFYKISN